MFQLIYSNLRQRPTRTCVSIFAVGLGVVLVLVCVGLSYGQFTDTAERTRRIGGDFVLQPSGASFLFALDSGTLPMKIREVIEEVEGVKVATPILTKFSSNKFHLVFGIDKESFQQVNNSLRILEGRIFGEGQEALIDDRFALQHQLDVGDELAMLGHVFTISGVFKQGTASRVLVSLPILQEINGTPDRATMFFIRVLEGASIEVVGENLRKRFEHYRITKTADLQKVMLSDTPLFKPFLTTIISISVVVSFLVILLAMYSTMTERTREIGILKSLGASKGYIVELILKESLLICAIGVALGFFLTFIANKLILMTFPGLPVIITPLWRVLAAIVSIGSGTLGALYPAMKAATQDPVQALGYE